MNNIEKYRKLDDEIFEVLKDYHPSTINSKFHKEYPTTYFLINMFDTSATFVKNSVFESCENDDYYGAKILFRSLIEHFIRFKYLFINWSKTRSDAFAKKYLDYGNAREILDLIKAKVSEKQLFDPTFKIEDWNSFLKEHPDFKNKSRKEVDNETQKYTFKKIVEYLNWEFAKGNYAMSSFLGNLILEYSDLSSFVHGGIKSYQEMINMTKEEKRNKEYNRLSGLAFHMSSSIKLFSTLMYSQSDMDVFKKHYLKINEIMSKSQR